MACLDPETGGLVVRIVYDGPATSGKSTSVEWLAREFQVPLHDHGRHEGRTLYFEHLEYSGGDFDGVPIRCEVLSPPGQTLLVARRLEILRHADAIVFVADSRRPRLTATLTSLVGLEQLIQQLEAPPLPLVLQANHRDTEDPVDEAEFESALGHLNVRYRRTSIATEGKGVREAFILAVSSAVHRARQLKTLRRLTSCDGRFSSDELKERLTELASHDALTRGDSPLS